MTKSDNTVISSFNYAYDAAGNPSRRVEADGTGVTWTYDASNQLTAEIRSGTTAYDNQFIYDGVGNRVVQNPLNVTVFEYDAADQLQLKVSLNNITTYTYDGAGNNLIEASQTGPPSPLPPSPGTRRTG